MPKTKTTRHPQYEAILAEQKKNWPKHLEGGKQGNPYATLCMHCYGRHEPPHGEICPYDPPSISRQGAVTDAESKTTDFKNTDTYNRMFGALVCAQAYIKAAEQPDGFRKGGLLTVIEMALEDKEL